MIISARVEIGMSGDDYRRPRACSTSASWSSTACSGHIQSPVISISRTPGCSSQSAIRSVSSMPAAGSGSGRLQHRLGGGAHGPGHRLRHLVRCRHAGAGQPAVADHVDLPVQRPPCARRRSRSSRPGCGPGGSGRPSGSGSRSAGGWWPPPRTVAARPAGAAEPARPAPPAGRRPPGRRVPARRSRGSHRGRWCRRRAREQRPMPARAQALIGVVALSRGVHWRIGKPS